MHNLWGNEKNINTREWGTRGFLRVIPNQDDRDITIYFIIPWDTYICISNNDWHNEWTLKLGFGYWAMEHSNFCLWQEQDTHTQTPQGSGVDNNTRWSLNSILSRVSPAICRFLFFGRGLYWIGVSAEFHGTVKERLLAALIWVPKSHYLY